MTGVRRAILLSTGERYFAILINFATIAVVSRILTPGEIGVSVVGMAVVGIAMAAREFASGSFLIQRPTLTRDEIRAAFGVMLLVTTLIAVALCLAAPRIATIYDDPRLLPYLRVISVSLFLELLAVPIITLLRREMAFGKVALINSAGAATASAVTIVLALQGFSYMSFAYAWLSSAVVAGTLALGLGRQLWLFVPRLRGWQGMIAFGGYNGSISMLQKTYEALPYLLLGRILTVDAAALYSRSLMLCQLPDKIVLGGAISVVLPAFSAEARAGRSLKQPYLHAITLVTAIQWPALLVLAVLAGPVVEVLLGSQWEAVVPLVQIVAVASLWSFCFELNYPVLVSLGSVRDVFIRAAIVFPVSGLVIAGAAFLGLAAVAWSMMIIMPFQAWVSLMFVRRRIELRWVEIAAATWRSGIVALASATGPFLIAATVTADFDLSVRQGFLAGLVAAGSWLAAIRAVRHPLFAEIERLLPSRLAVPPGGADLSPAVLKE
jgi:O-antigen/teichoic acid export membrane protein